MHKGVYYSLQFKDSKTSLYFQNEVDRTKFIANNSLVFKDIQLSRITAKPVPTRPVATKKA